MTYEAMKNVKEGDVLYDAKMSRRCRRHITAFVQGHSKVHDGINVRSEGMKELIPYDDYLMFDV